MSVTQGHPTVGEGRRRRVAVAFLLLTSLWTTGVLAAPYLATHHRTSVAARRVAATPYVIGRFVCHQRADRSFHAWGVRLPVCTRCLGLYLGGPFGAAWVLASGRRWAPRRLAAARRLLLVAAVPTAVTVLAEWSGVVQPAGWVRAATAVPLGCAVAGILAQAVRGHLR